MKKYLDGINAAIVRGWFAETKPYIFCGASTPMPPPRSGGHGCRCTARRFLQEKKSPK